MARSCVLSSNSVFIKSSLKTLPFSCRERTLSLIFIDIRPIGMVSIANHRRYYLFYIHLFSFVPILTCWLLFNYRKKTQSLVSYIWCISMKGVSKTELNWYSYSHICCIRKLYLCNGCHIYVIYTDNLTVYCTKEHTDFSIFKWMKKVFVNTILAGIHLDTKTCANVPI